jgi:hypothetical protein
MSDFILVFPAWGAWLLPRSMQRHLGRLCCRLFSLAKSLGFNCFNQTSRHQIGAIRMLRSLEQWRSLGERQLLIISKAYVEIWGPASSLILKAFQQWRPNQAALKQSRRMPSVRSIHRQDLVMAAGKRAVVLGLVASPVRAELS